jgi:hypothetical protein
MGFQGFCCQLPATESSVEQSCKLQASDCVGSDGSTVGAQSNNVNALPFLLRRFFFLVFMWSCIYLWRVPCFFHVNSTRIMRIFRLVIANLCCDYLCCCATSVILVIRWISPGRANHVISIPIVIRKRRMDDM